MPAEGRGRSSRNIPRSRASFLSPAEVKPEPSRTELSASHGPRRGAPGGGGRPTANGGSVSALNAEHRARLLLELLLGGGDLAQPLENDAAELAARESEVVRHVRDRDLEVPRDRRVRRL